MRTQMTSTATTDLSKRTEQKNVRYQVTHRPGGTTYSVKAHEPRKRTR